ncbi:hypothetical protein [Actibacterium sp. 188UL27-1]|uniref:hypothetical protein n=1 Tax=Actibacterium sp. 188UL27-1 TaxID=2786961 RepID=UPI0019593A6E|nr:hypothetical protein [Actibacterium sp. 188UL27-1]MBM7066060.1 hypothetical protein [Actibacterium sp. 188UL27-1]
MYSGRLGIMQESVPDALQVGHYFIFMASQTAISAGGPIYLIVGAPVFWMVLRGGKRSPAQMAGFAFVANLVATPVCVAVLGVLVYETGPTLHNIVLMTGFGAVFAPLWAALFSALYQLLTWERWLMLARIQ